PGTGKPATRPPAPPPDKSPSPPATAPPPGIKTIPTQPPGQLEARLKELSPAHDSPSYSPVTVSSDTPSPPGLVAIRPGLPAVTNRRDAPATGYEPSTPSPPPTDTPQLPATTSPAPVSSSPTPPEPQRLPRVMIIGDQQEKEVYVIRQVYQAFPRSCQ